MNTIKVKINFSTLRNMNNKILSDFLIGGGVAPGKTKREERKSVKGGNFNF